MASWWPHLDLHGYNQPCNVQGVLYSGYLFHPPLEIASVVLAFSVLSFSLRR
jgi:hypothetical protein